MRKVVQIIHSDGLCALAEDGTVWKWVDGAWQVMPDLPVDLTPRQKLERTREAAHAVQQRRFTLMRGFQSAAPDIGIPPWGDGDALEAWIDAANATLDGWVTSGPK